MVEIKKDEHPESKVVLDFHLNADTDATRLSQHHTLGNKHNQASYGDHAHDGELGVKLGTFTLTGKNTPASVAELDTIVDQLIVWLKTIFNITDSRT